MTNPKSFIQQTLVLKETDAAPERGAGDLAPVSHPDEARVEQQ